MGYLLGLGHKALVGKDSVGDYLVSEHRWVKKSFADNLKRCCISVFGLSHDDVYDQELKAAPLRTPVIYNRAINDSIFKWMSSSLGREVLPSSCIMDSLLGRKLFTPRDILQFVGTDVMRSHVPDYHVITCLNNLISANNYVVCDVRFPNEATAIWESNGFCVKIVRPQATKGLCNAGHLSETAMNDWADWYYIIHNNRDGLHFLYEEVEKLLQELKNVR